MLALRTTARLEAKLGATASKRRVWAEKLNCGKWLCSYEGAYD